MKNKLLSHSRIGRAWVVAVAHATLGLGQVAQNHPELCGRPNLYVPLPAGVTAVSSDGSNSAQLSISLSSGLTTKVETQGANQVQQVCPLGKDKLLVLGVTDNAGYDVEIISRTTGAVLDSFLCRSPMVSPDQRWLVFRQYYPPQSDIDVTEQYMLYDLTKDAAGNHVPGVDYRYVAAPGRTIYPATSRHAPFEGHLVLPEQVHDFASDSFSWSQDSRSIAFADRSPAGLRIVLVRIAAEDLTTYVHQVSGSRACGDANIDAEQVRIPLIEVASTQEAVPQVWVDLGASCGARTLALRAKDFGKAQIEAHPQSARHPSVGVKKQ